MKGVIFGAGNIGRGFIGALFSQAGLDVTFIDVSPVIIDRMNTDKEYPLHIVGEEEQVITIKNVCAVSGNDKDAAVAAIAEADIAATCVGANAIKFIIPNLSAGIKARVAAGKKPLNLLICENLMDADAYIHSLLEPVLTAEEIDQIGLVETSVGRMVPVPKATGENENPLKIAVEEYGVLPVDKAAFKGEVPEIKNIVPFTPFHYYIERKLYIHNMGHAVCAYFGKLKDCEYIYQSIADAEIRLLVHNAMLESCEALSTKYGTPIKPLLNHASDLIRRFSNKALGDTCQRVGADIPRKLALSDRLTGGALSILEQGSVPVYTCAGAAAALACYVKENGVADGDEVNALTSLTGLDKDHKVTLLTLELYEVIKAGGCAKCVLKKADEMLHRELGMIV